MTIKVKKSKILSEDGIPLDQLLKALAEAANPIQNPSSLDKSLDYQAATSIATSLSTSCIFYTSPSSFNPSSHYGYANNPGLLSCSSPDRSMGSSSPMTCVYAMQQNACPLYRADFSILRKVETSSNLFYYLSKFRIADGSYVYRIYDSNSNVYSNFNYLKIKIDDNSPDEDAVSFYEEFLADLGIQYSYQNVADDCIFEQVQKNIIPYFSTLTTKD